MAALDHEHVGTAARHEENGPYSVRRSIAIIAGLSLGFWGALALIAAELF
jgi:hypothetical protein